MKSLDSKLAVELSSSEAHAHEGWDMWELPNYAAIDKGVQSVARNRSITANRMPLVGPSYKWITLQRLEMARPAAHTDSSLGNGNGHVLIAAPGPFAAPLRRAAAFREIATEIRGPFGLLASLGCMGQGIGPARWIAEKSALSWISV